MEHFGIFSSKSVADHNGTNNHKCVCVFCNWNEANDVHVCVIFHHIISQAMECFFLFHYCYSHFHYSVNPVIWHIIHLDAAAVVSFIHNTRHTMNVCLFSFKQNRFLSTLLKHIIETAIKCETKEQSHFFFFFSCLFGFFFISFNIFDELKLPFYNFIALQQAITLLKRLVNDIHNRLVVSVPGCSRVLLCSCSIVCVSFEWK